MTYTPKSDDQLVKESLMPDGEYDWECVDTNDKPSSKGNDMFTLKLHVFDEEGQPNIIMDYIALGNTFGERKLRHAADSGGIIDIYESGKLVAADFLGRTGKLKIKTQEAQGNYDAKNVVASYTKRGAVAATPVAANTDELNDEIPF